MLISFWCVPSFISFEANDCDILFYIIGHFIWIMLLQVSELWWWRVEKRNKESFGSVEYLHWGCEFVVHFSIYRFFLAFICFWSCISIIRVLFLRSVEIWMQRLTGYMSMRVLVHMVWVRDYHGINSIWLNHFLIQLYTMHIILWLTYCKEELLTELSLVLLGSSLFYCFFLFL